MQPSRSLISRNRRAAVSCFRWRSRFAGDGGSGNPAWVAAALAGAGCRLGEKAALPCRDAETLQLPQELALFPQRELNHDLYLWLIALAAAHNAVDLDTPWQQQNQQATVRTLARYPGLQGRYHALAAAALTLRIPPEQLPPDEAAPEIQLRQALLEPGSVLIWLPAARPLQPVPLWLYPAPVRMATKPPSPSRPAPFEQHPSAAIGSPASPRRTG
jgi:nitric oxide reductase NorD protein